MTSAVLFQNMPPLSPEEYQALESSIREHGIQVPIVVDENRIVIDGHHRQKIAQELGIDCPKRMVFDKTDAEKRTLALSLNLDRRHLNREQRRGLIAESIKADPQLSNREHAQRTGVSHPTVGAVRAELEQSGDVESFTTRTDSLGREQPASRPREILPPFDPATGEVIEPSTPSPKVVGIDGKEYSRPQPANYTPRADALPKQYLAAIVELDKALEKIEKLHSGDRFTANKKNVALIHKSDIQRAIHRLEQLETQL